MDDERQRYSGRRRVAAGWIQRRGEGHAAERTVSGLQVGRNFAAGVCPNRSTCPSCAEVLRRDLEGALVAIDSAHRASYLLSAALLHLEPEELQILSRLLASLAEVRP